MLHCVATSGALWVVSCTICAIDESIGVTPIAREVFFDIGQHLHTLHSNDSSNSPGISRSGKPVAPPKVDPCINRTDFTCPECNHSHRAVSENGHSQIGGRCKIHSTMSCNIDYIVRGKPRITSLTRLLSKRTHQFAPCVRPAYFDKASGTKVPNLDSQCHTHMSDRVPDRVSLLRFCHRLEEHGLSSQTHIGANVHSGVVHTVVGTTIHVIGVGQGHALLHGNEQILFADISYQCAAKRPGDTGADWLSVMRLGKREEKKHAPLDAMTEQAEKLKASIRTIVEQPFPVIMRQLGHIKVRYLGLA